MNIGSFEFSLRKNYLRHNGPFNWLATGHDLAIYKLLSKEHRQLALHQVYTRYFGTLTNLYDSMTPIERVYRIPTPRQEIFELIQCAELVRQAKAQTPLKFISVGDYQLPANVVEAAVLIRQFERLKTSIDMTPGMEAPWIEDCREAWGAGVLHDWFDRQTVFLSARLKAMANKAEGKLADTAKVAEAGEAKDGDTQAGASAAATGSKPDAKPDIDSIWNKTSAHIVDLSAMGIDEARAGLTALTGLAEAKKKLNDLIALNLYTQARAAAVSNTGKPGFNNFVFSGPPGVGKTTLALAAASLLAACGILKKRQAIFANASAMIGRYAGGTEHRIEELFQDGRGGAIIIDEADSWAKDGNGSGTFDLAAITTFNAMLGYEKDRQTGTVVILTGYEAGIRRLFDANPGLRRRFPNHVAIAGYDTKTLRDIFASIVDARGYVFDEAVIEAAFRQIATAKDHMGERFGNVGTVEEMIQVMEAGRANRIGIERLRSMSEREIFDPASRTLLSKLDQQDVPVFDKSLQSFKVSPIALVASRER